MVPNSPTEALTFEKALEELETLVLPWQANRVPTWAFFAPAGGDIR